MKEYRDRNVKEKGQQDGLSYSRYFQKWSILSPDWKVCTDRPFQILRPEEKEQPSNISSLIRETERNLAWASELTCEAGMVTQAQIGAKAMNNTRKHGDLELDAKLKCSQQWSHWQRCFVALAWFIFWTERRDMNGLHRKSLSEEGS